MLYNRDCRIITQKKKEKKNTQKKKIKKDIGWYYMNINLERNQFHFVFTVKPAHVVTSIKQLSVLKGRLFLVLSEKFI